MSFTILTDTSANLPSALVRERDIKVIPYHYTIGDKQYSCLDTEGFDGKKFFKAMRLGADIKTSAINFQSYVDFFEQFLSQGQDILFVSMSSGISSSFNCSEIAKKELVEKYPDRKILLVDTLGASLGEGIFVLKAADYRDEGMTIDDTYQKLEDEKACMYQVFTVDDLMYLKKTGRLTGSAAVSTGESSISRSILKFSYIFVSLSATTLLIRISAGRFSGTDSTRQVYCFSSKRHEPLKTQKRCK